MQSYNPEKSIGFLIYEISRLMRRDFDSRVRAIGLTQAQWRAIAHVSHVEGCNQTTLADILEIKPMTLTRLVDRLVETGWLGRRPDPRDRRAVRLHLTEKAWPLIELMREKALETRMRAVQGIGQEEYERLFELLKKMKVNLSE